MTVVVLAAASAVAGGHELLGAAVAAGSALLYDAGYVLEKQALATLPPIRLHPADLLRTAARSPRWLAGFVAMLAGLVLQVVALTLAPVAVVQPILAGGLIALAAVGPQVLGERLTGRQKAALVLVLAAVVEVGLSARGADRMAHTVPALRFSALTAVIGGLAGLAVLTATRSAPARRAGPALAGLVAIAAGAGLLYGMGAVAEKAVATRLVDRGVVAGAVSSLGTAFPWLFLVVTLCGMLVFQVGLQAHPASLMASLTNVVSTACALAGAAVVFGEPLLPAGWWAAPRLVGFAAVAAAVAILSVETPAGADPDRAGGGMEPGAGADLGRPDPAVTP